MSARTLTHKKKKQIILPDSLSGLGRIQDVTVLEFHLFDLQQSQKHYVYQDWTRESTHRRKIQ